MEETLKSDVQVAAKDAIDNLVYTVVFDTCNEMIAAGMDQAKILERANAVVSKYVSEGIKLRRKPAPRVPKQRIVSSQTDAVTAASRKMKQKVSNNFVWVPHPSNTGYSYTKDAQLATAGYPLKENKSNKIVGVVDDNTSHALSPEDVRIAMSIGLQIDFGAVKGP